MAGIFDSVIRGELVVDLLLAAVALGMWIGGRR